MAAKARINRNTRIHPIESIPKSPRIRRRYPRHLLVEEGVIRSYLNSKKLSSNRANGSTLEEIVGGSKPHPKLSPPALASPQAEFEAMGAEDLLHQGQPQAATIPLGGEEGCEEEGADILRDTRAAVLDR